MSRLHSSPDTTLTMQSTVFPVPVPCESIFRSHQLQPTQHYISHMRGSQPDWVLAVLLCCFILFAWARVFYHKRIHQIFLAPFSRRFINQLTRDGNLFRERVAIALGIVYVLAFGLLLYEFNEQVVQLTFRGISGTKTYFLILVIIIVSITAKVTLVNILGAIFKTRETTYNYLLNLLVFALLTGPVLLTTLVFIIYLKSIVLLYICLAVFLLLFVFRLIRGFFIGLALTKFSYLFLFVYLCSLEILPFLVLAKILYILTQTTGA